MTVEQIDHKRSIIKAQIKVLKEKLHDVQREVKQKEHELKELTESIGK